MRDFRRMQLTQPLIRARARRHIGHSSVYLNGLPAVPRDAAAMAYLYGELGLEPSEAENRRYMRAAEHAIKHRQAPP